MDNGIIQPLHMHKKTNNIILVVFIFTFIITGCSSSFHLTSEETNQLAQSFYVNYLGLAQTDSALYYLDEICGLYAYESGNSAMKLGSLHYVDDMQVENVAQLNRSPERYSDLSLPCVNLQVFNDGLIYASMYDNVEGNIEYHLNYLTKDCRQRYTILELNYAPGRFLLQKSTIVVREILDSKDILHFYSLEGKEMKQISFDTSIYNMCVYENSIYVKLANELVKIDMETYDQKTVCSGEASYVAMYKEQVSYYILKDDGNHMVSEIKDINNGNITFTINECTIDYFDDDYVYTTSYNEEHTTYRIYDWNKNLVKEIRPCNTLGENALGAMPIGLQHSEFSTIARIWNHQLIGSCFGNQGMRIFTCDIDSGKCQYIIH